MKLALLLFASLLSAQTTTVCAAGSTPDYSYFGLTGFIYDYYGRAPAVTTGFGVKTGACSNAFLVTNVDTALSSGNSYATLRESLEYHIAEQGNWAFIGKGLLGVVQATTSSGTTTSGMFAGGVAISYDIGWALSRRKFHLPLVAQFLYTAITAVEVKPTYGIEFRKTF